MKRGWPAIQVEGDCLTVVRSLQMATPALDPFGAIVDGCLSFRDSFSLISYVYVPRMGNMLAHMIAQSFSNTCNEDSFLPQHLASFA